MTPQERKLLNAKLHALSSVICSSDEVLRSVTGGRSVKELTDDEAQKAHNDLKAFVVKQNRFKKSVLKDTGVTEPNTHQPTTNNGQSMSDGQRRAIIKITKYIFHWSPEATFSYILETCPPLRSRLNNFEIKKSSLTKLFSIMSRQDAHKVIRRLDKIQNANHKNKQNV